MKIIVLRKSTRRLSPSRPRGPFNIIENAPTSIARVLPGLPLFRFSSNSRKVTLSICFGVNIARAFPCRESAGCVHSGPRYPRRASRSALQFHASAETRRSPTLITAAGPAKTALPARVASTTARLALRLFRSWWPPRTADFPTNDARANQLRAEHLVHFHHRPATVFRPGPQQSSLRSPSLEIHRDFHAAFGSDLVVLVVSSWSSLPRPLVPNALSTELPLLLVPPLVNSLPTEAKLNIPRFPFRSGVLFSTRNHFGPPRLVRALRSK